MGSFSYSSHAGLFFIGGVSLTHAVLASFLSGECLLHIPCWLHFYLGCSSYKYRAGFIFMRGVSLTHPVLLLLLFSNLMLVSFLIGGVSLTHSVLASFFCGEFLLHILYRAERKKKTNKNWVPNGHIKERGIKEMDPSSEKAPLLAEKAPLLRTNSLGKSVKKSHSEPYNTLNSTEQTTSKKNWVKNGHRK